MYKMDIVNKSLWSIFVKFCDRTSLSGFGYITKKKITHCERWFWILINILSITLTCIIIIHLWQEYMANPNVLSHDFSNYPSDKVAFPGIAICNINKISKKKAMEFATYLSKELKNEKNVAKIAEKIKIFGGLFNYDVPDDEEAIFNFHTILEKYDYNDSIFDASGRIQKLTTSCEELFEKCLWGGRYKNCENLFSMRLIYEGYCCLFNYQRPALRIFKYQNNTFEKQPLKYSQGVGVEKGLTILLKNDIQDYFYTDMDTFGYNVHVFYPQDYPDRTSGSLTDVIVNANVETFIRLEASIIRTTEDVRFLPSYSKSCKFEDEEKTIFGGYRDSDCLVECRRQAMLYLCKCVPFMLPIRPSESICTLLDLPCLKRFKDSWQAYAPQNLKSDELDYEKITALKCDCKPACNKIMYAVHADFVPFNVYSNGFNYTKVNIYFDSLNADAFVQGVVVTWFEILSSFGGILSLFMGLSLISVVEIVIILILDIFFFIITALLKI